VSDTEKAAGKAVKCLCRRRPKGNHCWSIER